jgi:hypothetical protein
LRILRYFKWRAALAASSPSPTAAKNRRKYEDLRKSAGI